MQLRLAAIFVLLISAVSLPLIVTILLAVLCLIRFPDFYEAVPIFFINDALYGTPEHRYFGVTLVLTLVTLAAVFLSSWLRDRVFGSRTMHL